MKLSKSALGAGLVLLGVMGNGLAGPGNQFSNIGSIENTRHNLTQNTAAGGVAFYMNGSRNDYGEVCVYCHTPHVANVLPGSIPLWNRTMRSNTYQTYNQLGSATLTQTVSQPGANSLTCLSCHDGTTAVDSIINMPSKTKVGLSSGISSGSGINPAMATAAAYTGPNTTIGTVAAKAQGTFLNTWDNAGGTGPVNHQGFNVNTTSTLGSRFGDEAGSQGCMTCHSTTGALPGGNTGFAVSFEAFYIGTDLRNDHPVGITFPLPTDPVAVDFNMPTGLVTTNNGTSKFFDENSNGILDKGEIRVYNTGGGPEVECASCHDPHGVAPSVGAPFYRTFLRKDQGGPQGSVVCLTCHNK